MIRVDEVTKEYRTDHTAVRALRGVSLEVQDGEFLAIAGPSGSGKTTLLNLIGCLDVPSAGEIYIDGQAVSGQSRVEFIALFFFILGTTVIINTTMMVIFERLHEIGTIAALGMKPGEIVRLFFLEAFYISVISAFIGVLLGSALTLVLSRTGVDLSQMLQGVDLEVSAVIHPRLSLRSTVFVFFYSVAVSSLASFLPSRRAARIRPVEALRSI